MQDFPANSQKARDRSEGPLPDERPKKVERLPPPRLIGGREDWDAVSKRRSSAEAPVEQSIT